MKAASWKEKEDACPIASQKQKPERTLHFDSVKPPADALLCEGNRGLQWLLADMQKDINAARALVLRAAMVMDTGGNATMDCSTAKCFAAIAPCSTQRIPYKSLAGRLHPRFEVESNPA